jgi:hypothetical protein
MSTAWEVAVSGTGVTRFIGSISILDKNFNTKQQEKPEYIHRKVILKTNTLYCCD